MSNKFMFVQACPFAPSEACHFPRYSLYHSHTPRHTPTTPTPWACPSTVYSCRPLSATLAYSSTVAGRPSKEGTTLLVPRGPTRRFCGACLLFYSDSNRPTTLSSVIDNSLDVCCTLDKLFFGQQTRVKIFCTPCSVATPRNFPKHRRGKQVVGRAIRRVYVHLPEPWSGTLLLCYDRPVWLTLKLPLVALFSAIRFFRMRCTGDELSPPRRQLGFRPQ